MNDLISRKALIAEYDRVHIGPPGGARKLMKDAPTVDAAPIVHGLWEEWWPPKHFILTGEEMLYRCSACTAKYSDISGMNYCPFCGAKMDLQTEVTDEQNPF